MAKRFFRWLGLLLTLCAEVSAVDYRGGYVTVTSDLAPNYVHFATMNSDSFYKALSASYFQMARAPALTIYYAKDQDEARRLLLEHGQKEEAGEGLYVPSTATLYTYTERSDTENNWGELFAGITSHFVCQGAPNAPAWFEAGLRCFFSEQGRIEKGRLVIAHPAPGQEAVLKKVIDEGGKLTITRLVSTTDAQFGTWEAGAGFAQSLFYWLYENGLLGQYINTTHRHGYEVSALEEVTSNPVTKINVELLKFSKRFLQASDLVTMGLVSEDPNEQKKAFSDALELRPNYQAAKLELAKCFYREKNVERSRELLAEIMGASEPVEYRQAAQWMAASFSAQKDYRKAIEYYTNAWDNCEEYEYRYRLAYQIATCYYHLENEMNAKEWYRKFLDSKWDADDWTQQADFARQYLELHEKPAAVTADSNNYPGN